MNSNLSTKLSPENSTPPIGNVLLPAALSRLGKRQREVLKELANGGKIRLFTHFNDMYESATLIDADENDIDDLPPSILISFVKREIVYGYKVYSTIQPDTETSDYVLKADYVAAVKGCR